MPTGTEARRQALLSVADAKGYAAVRLGRAESFAWYTGGGDNRVDHAAEQGAAEVVVTADGHWVVTDNIEADRLGQEQVPGLEVLSHKWHETSDVLVQSLVGDGAVAGEADLGDALVHLRTVLDSAAQSQYRRVGADARAAVEEVAGLVSPAMTEWEASALLVEACRRRGLYVPVLMAAGEGRLRRYRHPIPADEPLGDRAMLVVCAERHGLYANLTRHVHFSEPDAESRRRQAACDHVLRELRSACRPGRTLGDVLLDGQALYEEAGFPGEWEHHHQGGLTGYASREVLATPRSTVVIQSGQAFAWNPSITGGGKAEETFLLGDAGAEVLTGVTEAQ